MAAAQASSTSEATPQLKYLGFVNTYSDKALELSAQYYTWGKSKLPPYVKNQIEQTESTVFKVGDPYYKYSIGVYDKVIQEADKRVQFLASIYESYLKRGEILRSQLKEQQDKLYNQIQESLDRISKQYPGITTNVQKQVDDLRKLPTQVSETAFGLQSKLFESWNQLLQDPRVTKLVERTKPQVEQTQKYLKETQEKILEDERYQKLYSVLTEYAKNVQANQYYKAVESRVLPVVKTYTDKVVSEEQQKYYQDVLFQNIEPKNGTKPTEAETSAPK